MVDSAKCKTSSKSKLDNPSKRQCSTLNQFFPSVVQVTTKSAQGEPSTVARVPLSPEQTHVLHMVTEECKNIFFTGAAGMILNLCSIVDSQT